MPLSVVGSPVIIGIYDSDDEMPSRKRGSCNDDDDGLKPTKKCHANSFQEVMNIPDDSDSSDQFDALRYDQWRLQDFGNMGHS